MGPRGGELLNRLDLRAELDELLLAEDLPHVREHLPLLLGDVLADLAHERGQLVVERWIVGVHAIQALQGLLRLGMLLLGPLSLLGADLLFDRRVDLRLLRHGTASSDCPPWPSTPDYHGPPA
ncbi:MAG: hypothetical protein M3417_13910 [Actinomycetota bacterium]|nr:hypothetical protein [Actinomycetota bacterium]